MKTLKQMGSVILMMMALSIPGFSGEEQSVSAKEGKPILIRQNPTDPVGAPRSPESHPFFAELMGSYVILGSAYSCGTVTVDLFSTAGDDYTTEFDTSDGAILLPISGMAGDYTLIITVSEDVSYIGEFTI